MHEAVSTSGKAAPVLTTGPHAPGLTAAGIVGQSEAGGGTPTRPGGPRIEADTVAFSDYEEELPQL